jgi:hypothetical protein
MGQSNYIKFNEIYSAKNLKGPLTNKCLIKNMEQPGVYIWGFVFNKEKVGQPRGIPLDGFLNLFLQMLLRIQTELLITKN